MSNCLCETCPFGSPNLTYAAVHCLQKMGGWPGERATDYIAATATPKPAWQAHQTMSHLFTRLAA